MCSEHGSMSHIDNAPLHYSHGLMWQVCTNTYCTYISQNNMIIQEVSELIIKLHSNIDNDTPVKVLIPQTCLLQSWPQQSYRMMYWCWSLQFVYVLPLLDWIGSVLYPAWMCKWWKISSSSIYCILWNVSTYMRSWLIDCAMLHTQLYCPCKDADCRCTTKSLAFILIFTVVGQKRSHLQYTYSQLQYT